MPRFRLDPVIRRRSIAIRSRVPIAFLMLASVSGCSPSTPLEGSGVSIGVPESWQPASPDAWTVPGVPLAAWAGPKGSSFVIYRSLPIPGGTAAMIVESLRNRLTNLPDLKVLVHREETVAGQPAARVEVVASGGGDAFAPSGAGTPVSVNGKPLIPTRQVTVGFARPDATLFLSWHMPEQDHEQILPEIETMLKRLSLAERPGAPSSYTD